MREKKKRARKSETWAKKDFILVLLVLGSAHAVFDFQLNFQFDVPQKASVSPLNWLNKVALKCYCPIQYCLQDCKYT